MNTRIRIAMGASRLQAMGALALAALLLGMAVPSMTATMDSVKLSAASGLLLSGMHLARSEAMAKNIRVALCKSANGVSCAGSGGWEQGWIVFHDANANGSRERSEPILRHEIRLSSSLRVYGSGSLARDVSFVPSGAPRAAGGGLQSGTLTVCRRSAAAGEARQIVLDGAGQTHLRTAAVKSCA